MPRLNALSSKDMSGPKLPHSTTSANVHYHLCPRCGRATPAAAKERFCPNDGTKLLTQCPQCSATITSPYGHYCSQCGHDFSFLFPNVQKPQS
jgi:hypothetical protein